MASLQPEGTGLRAWLTRTSYLVYSLRQWLLAREHAGLLPWDDPILAPAFAAESWAMQEDNLRAMRDALAGIGGRLVVVAVPLAVQLDAALLAREPARLTAPQRQLAAVCARLGLPLLDLHGPFVQDRSEALFTDGLHLTAAGHRLVGRELVAFVDQSGSGR
jgi:lysophospholipase L1-like esterase